MAQPWKAVDDFTQDQRRAVAVLNVGGMDHRMYQIALGFGEDVALAALDLLAHVIASRAATFIRFPALSTDHAGKARKSCVPGKICSVRVDLGFSCYIKKKN